MLLVMSYSVGVLFSFDPCCVEEGIDTDGVTAPACGGGVDAMNCEQFDQGGIEDGQCADEMFVVRGFYDVDAPGCCKPNGVCGLNVWIVSNFGCMARDSPGLSMLGTTFEPATCDWVDALESLSMSGAR